MANGRITWNGVDIRQMKQSDLLRRMWIYRCFVSTGLQIAGNEFLLRLSGSVGYKVFPSQRKAMEVLYPIYLKIKGDQTC